MSQEESDPHLYDRGIHHRFGVLGKKRKLSFSSRTAAISTFFLLYPPTAVPILS
jgi:hypothetical protein